MYSTILSMKPKGHCTFVDLALCPLIGMILVISVTIQLYSIVLLFRIPCFIVSHSTLPKLPTKAICHRFWVANKLIPALREEKRSTWCLHQVLWGSQFLPCGGYPPPITLCEGWRGSDESTQLLSTQFFQNHPCICPFLLNATIYDDIIFPWNSPITSRCRPLPSKWCHFWL